MPRLRVEFDAGWSREKMRVVSAQLRRELAFFGGVSGVSDIVPVDETEVAAAGPQLLDFYCTANPFGKGRCDQDWQSEFFTPCPVHGRTWVKKGVRPASEPVEPEVAATT